MEEIYKDIPGYEGLYQVSNLGNIKSFYNNRHGIKGWKIKKLSIGNNGYCIVNLTKNKKGKVFTVHRLIGICFLNNIENKPCINHIDGNRLNNNLDNLEWATISENNQHTFDNNFRPSKKVGQYNKENYLIKEWNNGHIASKETGIQNTTIYRCCNGKQKTSGGFIWKFI